MMNHIGTLSEMVAFVFALVSYHQIIDLNKPTMLSELAKPNIKRCYHIIMIILGFRDL